MDQYITGAAIKRLREGKNLTQAQFAEKIGVSDKAVSKWETGKGFPDITLLTPIAEALDISVVELLSGSNISNANRTSNMLRSKFYVCPICGNVFHSTGEAVISCCGVTLPPLIAEEPEEAHTVTVEEVEDEYYVTTDHPMTKEHYISFFAAVYEGGSSMVKLYPEGNAEARFKSGRFKRLYYYCNKDGLFVIPLRKKRMTGNR